MRLEKNNLLIQRKFWKLFGATVYVKDKNGNSFLQANLKAFRLKEEITVQNTEKNSTYVIIRARNIIDFAATYGVFDPEGNRLGALQRKGLQSTFVRDEWMILNDRDYQIGTLQERSALKSFIRRYLLDSLGFLFPQTYDLYDMQGNHVATMEQNRNPFIYKLQVQLKSARPEKIDDRLTVAAGLLLASIEGKE